jgi:hypothetical protein
MAMTKEDELRAEVLAWARCVVALYAVPFLDGERERAVERLGKALQVLDAHEVKK